MNETLGYTSYEDNKTDFSKEEYTFDINALEAHFARLAVANEVEINTDQS